MRVFGGDFGMRAVRGDGRGAGGIVFFSFRYFRSFVFIFRALVGFGEDGLVKGEFVKGEMDVYFLNGRVFLTGI